MTEKRYQCRKCTMAFHISNLPDLRAEKSVCPDCSMPFEHIGKWTEGRPQCVATVVATKLDQWRPSWREDVTDYDVTRKAFSPDALRRIINAVSEASGVPVNGLLNGRSARHWSRPRQVAMYLMRQCTRAAYGTIAGHLNRRDPTTAMYAWKRVDRAIRDRDERYTDILRDATRILSEGA